MTRPSTPNILDNVLSLSGATPAPPAQRSLALTAIRRDGGTQPREGIDWDHVKDMQQALADGALLPAVSVIYDGADYWLWDGFHRWHAYNNIGQLEIPVIISQGTQDDAQWESFAANQAHGLKRTPSERERAIRGALKHPKSAGMSNSAIAKHLGVSDKTVAQYREKMELSSEIPKITTRTVERNGQVYQQNTANIGATRPAPPVMLAVWELQATVREVYAQVYGGNPEPYATRDMRTGAQMRAGRFWLLCTQSLPANQFRLSDLAQAINNVAAQVEAQPQAPVVAMKDGVTTMGYVVPADAPGNPQEQLVQLLLDATRDEYAEWILAAAEGKHPRIFIMCENLARQEQYFGCDIKAALREVSRRRYEAGQTAPANPRPLKFVTPAAAPQRPAPPPASYTVPEAVDDKPLPDWAAEPEAAARRQAIIENDRRMMAEINSRTSQPEPATVAQTVADVVETQGDPAPVAEPAEALPVSQRADYESDEWYTPQEYIDAAKAVMGAIDLDPASSEMAQTVVRAGAYLTKWDNGLAMGAWIHQRIWLNPPYSNPGTWIEMLLAQHDRGVYCQEAIVLVNNATETAWFQALLQRFPVCFPSKRIAFWRHDHANVGARQGQAFFYLGPNVARFQEIFSQFGPILRRLS